MDIDNSMNWIRIAGECDMKIMDDVPEKLVKIDALDF